MNFNDIARIPGTTLPWIELVPLQADQAATVHRWFDDEKVRPWLDLGGGRQQLQVRELYLLLTGSRSFTRLLRLPGSTEPLGLVCLGDVSNQMGSADIWGVRGCFAQSPGNVSVASFLLMLANGFVDLGREVIGSWVVEGNQFSIAMHQRLGMRETGRQRARHLSGGQRRDRLLFDITRAEFAERFGAVRAESGRCLDDLRSEAAATPSQEEPCHV
ncbi:MAG: GNAT family N-acetyltransferase [Rubrivivax sp.]|nr:GNAT family N-acetyltransferase [Rubrivivax sp.]